MLQYLQHRHQRRLRLLRRRCSRPRRLCQYLDLRQRWLQRWSLECWLIPFFWMDDPSAFIRPVEWLCRISNHSRLLIIYLIMIVAEEDCIGLLHLVDSRRRQPWISHPTMSQNELNKEDDTRMNPSFKTCLLLALDLCVHCSVYSILDWMDICFQNEHSLNLKSLSSNKTLRLAWAQTRCLMPATRMLVCHESRIQYICTESKSGQKKTTHFEFQVSALRHFLLPDSCDSWI